MTDENGRGTTPQDAQRNGQSAISQDSPLNELRQEGDARGDRPTGARSASSELSDEEVSVLCDIGRDGRAKSADQSLVQRLIERGFATSSGDLLPQLKLTMLAQQILGKRGVGLNES
jgi:hypothetical protein